MRIHAVRRIDHASIDPAESICERSDGGDQANLGRSRPSIRSSESEVW
ncbi:hypothetical protein [Rhodopirellula bahusiensis]